MSEQESPFDEEVLETEVEAEEVETEEEAPDDIEVAFDEAVAADKSEDEVMLSMIEAGATFKNVKSRYNALMVDNGFLDSRAEKQEIVKKTMEGRDLTTEEGMDGAVAALVEALKGVTDKSAAASIRQYAKKAEIDVYKKPKGEGAGRSGITSQFHDWVIAQVPVSDKDVAAWIEANGTENTKRHSKTYLGQAHLANRAFNKVSEAQAA